MAGRPTLTLAALLEAVRHDRKLSSAQRTRILCSLRAFVRLTGLNPRRTKASFGECRAAMNRFEPARIGMKRARWGCIRSDVALAFGRYASPPIRRGQVPLSPAWQALRTKLGRSLHISLSRFMTYCSRNGVAPDAVNDCIAVQFFQHIAAFTSVANPKQRYWRTCARWNQAADTVPGWPPTSLTMPKFRAMISFPWSAFPPSFVADVQAWAEHAVKRDIFDEDAPERPLRPITVEYRVRDIRRFASGAVRAGVPIQALRDLRALTTPAIFRAGVRFFWERAGNRSSCNLYHLAYVIREMAADWVKPDPASLMALRRLTRRLHCRPYGLSPSMLAILEQFDDPANVQRLIALPAALAERARSVPQIERAAVMVQQAVAIELQLVAPLRPRALRNLRLDRHFRIVRNAEGPSVRLVVPAEDTKNHIRLTFDLPTETVRLLETYLRVYLPALTDGEPTVLFPGASGEPKTMVGFSHGIARRIWRHTGLRMTVQAFRHLAAKLYLDRYPGQYFPVGLLLGHQSFDTTRRYYGGLESRVIARHHAEHVIGRAFSVPSPPVPRSTASAMSGAPSIGRPQTMRRVRARN